MQKRSSQSDLGSGKEGWDPGGAMKTTGPKMGIVGQEGSKRTGGEINGLRNGQCGEKSREKMHPFFQRRLSQSSFVSSGCE
jgi:hypothetical protein